jgi:hyperosmotically inducible periplasmic protein
MFAKSLIAALMLLALGTPAFAQSENLQVFRDVQKQVLRYPHFTLFDNVNAQIDNGAVTLSGKVTMPYKRDEIARRVSGVAGVQTVDNQIEVLPVSQWDDQLRFSIARAIYSHPVFAGFGSMVNPPIHIIVEHGRVTLEGVVNNELDRRVARSIAGAFNAFAVKSELKTEAEVKDALEKL